MLKQACINKNTSTSQPAVTMDTPLNAPVLSDRRFLPQRHFWFLMLRHFPLPYSHGPMRFVITTSSRDPRRKSWWGKQKNLVWCPLWPQDVMWTCLRIHAYFFLSKPVGCIKRTDPCISTSGVDTGNSPTALLSSEIPPVLQALIECLFFSRAIR